MSPLPDYEPDEVESQDAVKDQVNLNAFLHLMVTICSNDRVAATMFFAKKSFEDFPYEKDFASQR